MGLALGKDWSQFVEAHTLNGLVFQSTSVCASQLNGCLKKKKTFILGTLTEEIYFYLFEVSLIISRDKRDLFYSQVLKGFFFLKILPLAHK